MPWLLDVFRTAHPADKAVVAKKLVPLRSWRTQKPKTR